MKAYFMLAIALMISGFTSAQNGLYRCEEFGDYSEWTIEIDLNQGLSWFFDNASTEDEIAKVTQVRSLESCPPQTVYYFKSLKTDLNRRYSLVFNETKEEASLTVNMSGRQKTFESSRCISVEELYFPQYN